MSMSEYIYAKYLFPIFAFICFNVLIIAIMCIWIGISGWKATQIDNYMKSIGYEYHLKGVASFGDKAWWEYRKGDIRIDTDDLYKMKMRDIKKRFK